VRKRPLRTWLKNCAKLAGKREQLDAFLGTVLRQDSLLTEFNESLWYAILDKVTATKSEGLL